jgi:hypothetical protein
MISEAEYRELQLIREAAEKANSSSIRVILEAQTAKVSAPWAAVGAANFQ